MNTSKFSFRARVRSFGYALAGIRQFLIREHNAWIHLAATLVVTGAAIVLGVSGPEAIALAIVVGLVWITEMLNTCVERTMDLISRAEHPEIRFIKDLAAGAVLASAGVAVVVGCIIFIPKIYTLTHG